MNEFQQQAVCSDINAPVCIIAGPGSGKTKTIVERVKHIQYTQSHYKPPYSPKMSSSSSAESTTAEVAKILILSFSKSAVTEMKSRLQNENINQQQVHVSTFHGLGYRIITKYWSLLGFTKCPTKCSQKIAYNILKVKVACHSIFNYPMFYSFIFLLVGCSPMYPRNQPKHIKQSRIFSSIDESHTVC